MDNNGSQPTLAQLRNRQTELVLALANETRTDRLQQYSDELEFLVKHIQEREEAEAAGAPAPSAGPDREQAQGAGVEQREDGVVIEPGSDLEADVDADGR
ncbi:hypothetical protein MUK71_01955 [Arthrobacter zhangbolii]|uniref:Uncharacterized protein n=1 Tax=Arthrobacter zhangbolii TaxID=2886936 RepID=A0A9X1M8L7_9MICC|nr:MULTISPECIES: hypothetical protein [Arthrobacter]MCC3273638.1 hypothetical protein [Arthrobacter zhangbolii]MCC3295703.1 hypothetical protein [Arthrobacter zhangbolii]MDN3905919.1 hypothetical protein [Arthrobacter sp. YD2]UON92443.1 hypothetical protein MUK71_01955 [Arthrobacter zhangbolii]